MIGLAAMVLGISAGMIISVTAIVCRTVRRYRERQLAVDLIHSLADRGMTADEIERLVVASAAGDPEEPEAANVRARIAALRG